jgi:hypothetical protein
VKSTDTESGAAAIKPHLALDAVVLSLQNGGGFKNPWRDDRRSASRVVSVIQTTGLRHSPCADGHAALPPRLDNGANARFFRFLRQGLGCPFAILCSRALLHAAGCSRRKLRLTQEIVPARISEQSTQAAPGPLHRTDGGFVLPTPRTDFFVCPEEPDFAFHFFGFTANIVHAF